MGKPEDELYLPTAVSVGGAESSSNPNGEGRCGCRLLGIKCLVVLLLGVAVFLSAAFWLPPLSKLSDPEDSDLDPRFRGYGIVASFKLKKSVIFLQENEDQLESDIFDELQVPYTKVVILSLDGSPGSNETDVVFAVDPQRKHTRMPAAAKSLIRSSFVFLVTGQSNLTLTTSLFEEPDNFEVLKFSGGITVAPPYQNAFLLQHTQIKFNFTLNFSIRQVIENFGELRSQLRSGLRLAYYENLYVSMTNLRGSTISSPVTIQSSVWLAVGIHPSTHRLKQLAQTITGPPSKNLGLNNTVFGKVKQVSLSSTLQHTLNDGASGSSAPAPAPTPLVRPHQHHHHHHHHHGHHHRQDYDHDTLPSPSISPSVPVKIPPPMPLKGFPPAPAPITGYHHTGPGCRYGFRRSHGKNISKQYTPAPATAPSISPQHASIPFSPVVPPPPAAYREPSSSPLPHVVLEHRHSPSRSEPDSEPPDEMPSKAFFPSKSDAGLTAITPWLFCLLIATVLQLLEA